MSLTAMWVHGNAVIAESPENLAMNVHLGFGTDTQVLAGRDCWFHAPMPTPVILRGQRPKLVRVIILFRADVGGARLQDVHLFDGSSRVVTFDVIEGGDHLIQDETNTLTVSPPREISFGLGVSFRFEASTFGDNPPQPVFIGAVGADWEFPD